LAPDWHRTIPLSRAAADRHLPQLLLRVFELGSHNACMLRT
jgi:hypothetical protein